MSIEKDARRLAAIVAADMVGYSRLMEFDEAGTITRQKAINDDLINPKVKEFGGRIVKTTGDGALIEFPSAVNAVLCAVAVQREMADRESAIPKDLRISYRIGINLGDIIQDGDDIFGDGVNVASRLEGLAEPGGINISDAVFNNVKGKLDLGFADLGLQKVKNLSEPISTFKVLLDPDDIGKIVKSKTTRPELARNVLAAFAVIVLIASGGYFALDRFTTRGSGEKKLLILPVTAENADSKLFADAATENLIVNFARLKGLTIVPRRISMEYKGINVSPEDLSEDLGVRYILDGSAKLQDDRVLLSARLRDARAYGDGVVWEETAIGEPTQLFDLLATLKQNAAGAMKVKLNSTERKILEAKPTESVEAYLAFARADRFLNSKEFTEVGDALQLFEEAIRLDPEFVDAQLGYARANFEVWRGSYNTIRHSLDSLKITEDILNKVLESDPSNPLAISLRVRVMIQNLNRAKALATARAAVFNNPDEPSLRNILGVSLLASGIYDGALDEFADYEARAPRLNAGEKSDLAWNYLRLGDHEKALSLLNSIPEQELKEQHYRNLAEAHFLGGNIEIAKANIAKFMKSNVWLNLMWMKPWFEIYSDPGVYENYATTMIGVGLPEWPYNFDKGRENDRVLHDDLMDLFSGKYKEMHGTDPFGAPYSEVRKFDGTIAMSFAWMNGIDMTGTWYIKNDQFCHRVLATHQGREECNNVYIDRANSTESIKFISNVYSFGVFNSEFRRVAD